MWAEGIIDVDEMFGFVLLFTINTHDYYIFLLLESNFLLFERVI
jgi:hypothetical protein